MKYCVVKYKGSERIGIVSGIGRHKGTWDYAMWKRTAERYAARFNKEQDGFIYKVEEA